MHALSAVLVFLFGGATLLLHDQHFIQWKPTVFFWLASIAFLGSFWIGEQHARAAATERSAQRPRGARTRSGVAAPERPVGLFYAATRATESRGGLQRERAVVGQFQGLRPHPGHARVCGAQVVWLARRSQDHAGERSAAGMTDAPDSQLSQLRRARCRRAAARQPPDRRRQRPSCRTCGRPRGRPFPGDPRRRRPFKGARNSSATAWSMQRSHPSWGAGSTRLNIRVCAGEPLLTEDS